MLQLKDFLSRLVSDAVASMRAWPVWKKIIVALCALGFVAVTVFGDTPSLRSFSSLGERLGPAFPTFFFLIYVVFTLFPIPRTIFTLSAGLLFGPVEGILLSLGATTVSAVISFLGVRWLLGDWMRPRLTHPAVVSIDQRLKARGWLSVASLRMIAAVPFSLLNYVAALSSVPLFGFTVATLFGSAPGTIATVLLGSTLSGQANPAYLAVVILLTALGASGLLIDAHLPVRQPTSGDKKIKCRR